MNSRSRTSMKSLQLVSYVSFDIKPSKFIPELGLFSLEKISITEVSFKCFIWNASLILIVQINI